MSTAPLFRADHVGSLLRPPPLRHAFRDHEAGTIDADAFAATQNQAIVEAIRLQEEVGLEAVTDGEFRRISYWARFVERVEGLTVAPAVFRFRDEAGAETDFLAPRVEAPVRRVQSIAGDELDFLRSHTTKTAKLTLPSPATMHFWGGRQGVATDAYADPDGYFDDLAAVYRDEIADLAARGCRYLQIDDVPLAMLASEAVRERLRADGENPELLIDRYIRLTNAAVAGRPQGMTLAMHLCRGNFKGRWLSEGGYEPVAERLFGEVAVDTFFLEYDTPRSGDFRPLRFVPPTKSVVLGLISTKTAALEPVDALEERIREASEFIPLDRLGVSPQCGFASTVGGNPVTIDDERRKLALVVATAARIWS
ncbi:MAG: 5-methyltetrahydropteroyltriglutamate--homocysteine S-methyltransferase [Gemmatimonadales bacterium]